MSVELIAQILMGLSSAIPEIMALFTKASAGGAVAAGDLQAIITKFGIDQAVFSAAIASAKASGK
jgi:hypothetical protein